MHQLLAVHEIEGRGDLGGHSFGVDLAESAVADVRRQITERREFLGEEKVALALEGAVVRFGHGRMRTQVVTVVELAEELASRRRVLADRLEHHLRTGPPVLGQQNLGEPALADRLQDVVLLRQIHLSNQRPISPFN